jgi:hypothetical protein
MNAPIVTEPAPPPDAESVFMLKMVGPNGETFNGSVWPLEPGSFVSAAAMHRGARGTPGLSGYRLGHHARINGMVERFAGPDAKWLVFRARAADVRDEPDHASRAPEGWVAFVGTRAEAAAWLRDHAGADPCLLPDVRVIAPHVVVEGLEADGVATAGPGFAGAMARGVEVLGDRQPAIATGPGAVAHARGVESVAVATAERGTAIASGSGGIAVGESADAYRLAVGRVRARGRTPGAVLIVGWPRPVVAVAGERGVEPGVWYRLDPATGKLMAEEDDAPQDT